MPALHLRLAGKMPALHLRGIERHSTGQKNSWNLAFTLSSPKTRQAARFKAGRTATSFGRGPLTACTGAGPATEPFFWAFWRSTPSSAWLHKGRTKGLTNLRGKNRRKAGKAMAAGSLAPSIRENAVRFV